MHCWDELKIDDEATSLNSLLGIAGSLLQLLAFSSSKTMFPGYSAVLSI
jgi:hypothetical protein